MSELKRPERYVQFESIKPELKGITEFYTRKIADYQYRIKQLNEYADALENEISVLKETLTRMKLDGYTVEKEQLYVLHFPSKTYPYVSFLNSSNDIINWVDNLDNAKRFTEKEIKAIDDRYWAFAVKVEEVEK